MGAPGIGGAKEAAAMVTRETMTQYSTAGFSYLGRVRLADAPSGPLAGSRLRRRYAANFTNEAGARPGLAAAKRATAAAPPAPRQQYVLRYTPAGDVYYMRDESGPAPVMRIPPMYPPRYREEAGPSAGRRALRMIIGSDERSPCGEPPRYPLTAVGQLDFVTQNQDFICSGALVRKDKVLTAAHCVWSSADRAFVRGVDFAAGRYRKADGTVVSPFGVQGWKHVTLVSDFPSGAEPGSDMAVVTLTSPVTGEAGTMGVDADCTVNDERPMEMNTAGYASDKYNGECVREKCVVSMGCGSEATPHTCDTYMVGGCRGARRRGAMAAWGFARSSGRKGAGARVWGCFCTWSKGAALQAWVAAGTGRLARPPAEMPPHPCPASRRPLRCRARAAALSGTGATWCAACTCAACPPSMSSLTSTGRPSRASSHPERAWLLEAELTAPAHRTGTGPQFA
jgi:V8-like Glu-specific endopeptidase